VIRRIESHVLGIGLLVALAWLPATAGAQQQKVPTFVEYRADAIVGRGTAVEGGAGIVIPAGAYVRTSIDGAGGVTWVDGSTRASGRVDMITRFLLDPYREVPIGVSLGGGVSVPYASGDRNVRPYLTAVVDVEGRLRHRVTPAVQIGFGGGTRVGFVLRTSPGAWR
jgi:hypothetical protein